MEVITRTTSLSLALARDNHPTGDEILGSLGQDGVMGKEGPIPAALGVFRCSRNSLACAFSVQVRGKKQ